jgi:NADH-quinone oxidoreductase subunit J
MLLGQAFFGVCAALAIIGALSTVIARNPIRGAMGLLLMIVAIAGLFLALHAQFLAAIQLIVYAGAIVVLFLFVIMLLGPASQAPRDQRGQIVRSLSAALFAGCGLTGAVFAWKTAPAMKKLLDTPPNDFGSIDTIGRVLFSDGIVPFELSSGLLMVAIVGAVAVARGKHKTDVAHGEIINVKAPDTEVARASTKEVNA